MSNPVALRVARVDLPDGFAEKLTLRAQTWRYSSLETVFYSAWLWGETFCGVAGDGNNAAYEWFIWRGAESKLETSDCGYGSTAVALRDVLLTAEPKDTVELAYKIADESAVSIIESNCLLGKSIPKSVAAGALTAPLWYDLRTANAEVKEKVQRCAQYLELRGLLKRDYREEPQIVTMDDVVPTGGAL